MPLNIQNIVLLHVFPPFFTNDNPITLASGRWWQKLLVGACGAQYSMKWVVTSVMTVGGRIGRRMKCLGKE
jgi:hypothetical protein